jgi:hypothetical protein
MRALHPILLSLGLAIVPAFASEAPGSVAPDPRTQVDEIARRVEAIRGLTFRTPVAVTVVGRDAIREYATRRMALFTPPEVLAREQRVFEVLGLLPKGTSMLEAYTGAIEESAAGYYDPQRKEFYLLGDLPGDVGSIFAAHELTHALEDQYYDLDARIDKCGENDDLGFAVMAVHEGSASVLMAVYLRQAIESGRVKREDLETLARTEAARGEKVAALAPVLRRGLLGAYLLGARFLERGKKAPLSGDAYPIEDADRCYRDGPVSSEQILHPEKYWDPGQRDLPRTVEPFHAGSLLGPGWSLDGEGSLGELLLGPLVGAKTPEAWTPEAIAGTGWTNEAAAGWGGDRWELWTRGEEAAVLLQTVWDSGRDAREFARALPARDDLRWKRSGDRVAVVAGGVDTEGARRLLREMLKR